eukprot:scaffold3356_cov112-Isochrysis_galbana.AAC.9
MHDGTCGHASPWVIWPRRELRIVLALLRVATSSYALQFSAGARLKARVRVIYYLLSAEAPSEVLGYTQQHHPHNSPRGQSNLDRLLH